MMPKEMSKRSRQVFDGWTDAWTDGGTNGWTDGQTNRGEESRARDLRSGLKAGIFIFFVSCNIVRLRMYVC